MFFLVDGPKLGILIVAVETFILLVGFSMEGIVYILYLPSMYFFTI